MQKKPFTAMFYENSQLWVDLSTKSIFQFQLLFQISGKFAHHRFIAKKNNKLGTMHKLAVQS